MVQGVTMNGNEWYSEWQQQMTTSGYYGKTSFFQIREESITKHHEEDPLNQRSWGGPWGGSTH